MILRSFGLLIPVVGISYLLAHASQHTVLLAFLCAGVGYAIWKVRCAFVRRAKIRNMWRRSVELEHLLHQFDDQTSYEYFVKQSFEVDEPRKLEEAPAPKPAPSRTTSKFPISKISSNRSAATATVEERKTAVC
ncbi:MAG: hypothetical protein KC777_21760 [Cyanobacteria bacterium HKST-UBA02]|nr:hypothetical protein [Cyanobacteria bacterium HKST-UBA02]